MLPERQRAVLRAEFPAWRIERPSPGGWIAARLGAPVVVCESAYELRGALRLLEACEADQ